MGEGGEGCFGALGGCGGGKGRGGLGVCERWYRPLRDGWKWNGYVARSGYRAVRTYML